VADAVQVARAFFSIAQPADIAPASVQESSLAGRAETQANTASACGQQLGGMNATARVQSFWQLDAEHDAFWAALVHDCSQSDSTVAASEGPASGGEPPLVLLLEQATARATVAPAPRRETRPNRLFMPGWTWPWTER
jgi:hypothetical protein